MYQTHMLHRKHGAILVAFWWHSYELLTNCKEKVTQESSGRELKVGEHANELLDEEKQHVSGGKH